MTMHEHEYQGQKLRHSHPGGDYKHGYFEHPEDGFPYQGAELTIETGTTRTTRVIGRDLCQAARAARDLGTVTKLAVDGAQVAAVVPLPDAEAVAVRDAIIAWQDGDEGARDRLNAIFASWAANSLPVPMQNRQEIADSIAMTITAGITPYLEAAVLRLAAKVREATS